MKFEQIKQIHVSLKFTNTEIQVGRLAIRDSKIYFEYDNEFLKSNLEISPFKMPLHSGLQNFDRFLFEGLPGVFYDSLPDGWGRLLLDRSLRTQGILLNEISPLDRLAYVGETGMGALIYRPARDTDNEESTINLNHLANQTQSVLRGKSEDVLQELIALNGSSAGARPKALIGVNFNNNKIIHDIGSKNLAYEPWLVKFSNREDGRDAGAIEYVYSLMAKQAGLTMTNTHLFPAQENAGFFATKRFDRNGQNRFHTHSACGLLHSDFRTPSLDYEELLALTNIVTRDMREVIKMYQLAVFNVLAYNRDDHTKNFSFLMDKTGKWKLSPAYDLTFSSGPNGEQSTMVMGEGKNPTINHLKKLAIQAKIKPTQSDEIISQTQQALSQWQTLSKQYDVHPTNIKIIQQKINLLNR